MLSGAAMAALFAIARSLGVLRASSALMLAIQLVIYGRVWGECWAEGSRHSEVDLARCRSINLRVGLPIYIVCSCLML